MYYLCLRCFVLCEYYALDEKILEINSNNKNNYFYEVQKNSLTYFSFFSFYSMDLSYCVRIIDFFTVDNG